MMRPEKFTWLVCLLFTTWTEASGDRAPVAHLSAGSVHGSRCSNRAQLFQGIPYAQPPVHGLRFLAPRAISGPFRNGRWDATRPPRPCIQLHSAFEVHDPEPSEDCLYLNVVAPPDATAQSGLPVKIFAYGGGNHAGAVNYPLFDSCNLAAEGAIVVAFNYRVGMLGFLTLPSAGIRGNMAIQDYLAALRWTRDNIAAFGGDPKKALLFGQSAGGVDSFALASIPEVKTLVAAVVLQSGSGIDLTPNETAQYTGKSYAFAVGCADHDLDCLQSKSVRQLRAAYQKTAAIQEKDIFKGHRSLGGTFGLNFPNKTNLNAPVRDGIIIKDEPLAVGSRVPVIVGSNGQDASLFTHKAYKADNSSAEEAYAKFLNAWGPVGPAIGKRYRLSAFNNSINAIVTHINTLAGFKCPAYKTLRATSAAGVPAFAYQFNHVPSCPWVWIRGKQFPPRRLVDEFGATHTAELPFVFGNLDHMPVGNGSCTSTATERALSRGLVDAWTAMAMNSDPSTDERPWPRFDECDPRGMLIQNQSMAAAPLDYHECNFWGEVWAELGGFRISVPTTNKCGSPFREAHSIDNPSVSKTALAMRSVPDVHPWLALGIGLSMSSWFM